MKLEPDILSRQIRLRDPAPGHRHYSSGTLNDIGRNGFCWSSSTLNSNVYYLDFYHGIITLNRLYYRAYGFQTRCLQE